MAGSKTDSNLVRSIINRDFMGMKKADLDELDHLIDVQMDQTRLGLENTPWLKNDLKAQSDVIVMVGDTNEDKSS